MASLHSALKYLSPTDWSDVPSPSSDLDTYLSDLFSHAQLIVESIPVQNTDEHHTRQRAQTTSSDFSSSEHSIASSVLSLPPHPEHESLRTEWGKPIKLSQKENPLNISVYKTSGKDSKGAWFARRSVHETMGFAKFKKAFEKEFPQSMSVQGGPGEGNIRGIGAEDRIEKIEREHGKIEVYRLSAQFPGPTTPRDFVTMLVTSSNALTPHPEAEIPGWKPRHYMIISKPCNHPESQPRNGFIRGQYESVEFIRELPRKLKASQSQTDLTHMAGPSRDSLEKDVLVRNAAHAHSQEEPSSPKGRKNVSFHEDDHPTKSQTPAGRPRSATTGTPLHHHEPDNYESEENPVEWMMVTRSDPGGSVPRFMVERGTPASIVGDVQKFLTWADKQEFSDLNKIASRNERNTEQANDQTSQLHEDSVSKEETPAELSPTTQPPPAQLETTVSHEPEAQKASHDPGQGGIFSAISGTVEAYTPHVVLDNLPGRTPVTSPTPAETTKAGAIDPPVVLPAETTNAGVTDPPVVLPTVDAHPSYQNHVAHDTASISSLSFTSAESHIGTDVETPSLSSKSQTISLDQTKSVSPHHEKELAKLASKRAALDAKLAAHREKVVKDTDEQTEKEKAAIRKAEEKHQKELKKHEERYHREIKKIEEKKKKEAQKIEEKRKKQIEKDDKVRLSREKDELKEQLDLMKKENDVLRGQVGDLQKNNTELVVRLGKYESGPGEVRAKVLGSENGDTRDGSRNRSATFATQ